MDDLDISGNAAEFSQKEVYVSKSGKQLTKIEDLDLSGTKMAVFGMSDSHYVYINEAAKLYDDVLRNDNG